MASDSTALPLRRQQQPPPIAGGPPMKAARTCSQCGNNGHNARTCPDSGGPVSGTGGGSGVMLFGVKLSDEGASFRKSFSLNNLSQYDQNQDSAGDVAAGYVSDDAVHAAGGGRERKRGVPWSEEEHRRFLRGLQKVGKGDWRGISRNFVKTRTPTQVASHAQKYFLRRSNLNRRRRRSSLFDITTDTVMYSSITEQSNQDLASKVPLNSTINLDRPSPALPLPPSSRLANLNLNESPSSDPSSVESFLSLTLSRTSPGETFPARPGGGFGDSMISVA